MEINELLRYAVERGASDLHLKVGNVPFIRVDGDLQPTQFPSLTPSDTEAFGMELMSDHKKREFEASSEADLGITLAGVGPVPRERVPSAWRGGARDPSRALGDPDVRRAPSVRRS